MGGRFSVDPTRTHDMDSGSAAVALDDDFFPSYILNKTSLSSC
jgi:hypothetical protein